MRDLISVTPARVDMPTREPRMTAIVLTHRRESELARTLAQLAKLPEQPAIVVVDNASNDGTAAMVRRRFPRATLVRAPRNLGAAGRNLGAACARTPYIAFCDDDTWWESGSLTLAAQLFERHPRIGALTARVLVGIERREDPTCALMRASPLEHAPQQPGPTILGLLAGATAFRRGAFCMRPQRPGAAPARLTARAAAHLSVGRGGRRRACRPSGTAVAWKRRPASAHERPTLKGRFVSARRRARPSHRVLRGRTARAKAGRSTAHSRPAARRFATGRNASRRGEG